MVQDGPPPGGFPSIRYARRLPSTGPTGFTLFAVGTAVMAFGFYRVRYYPCHIRSLCTVIREVRVMSPSQLLHVRSPKYPKLATSLCSVAWLFRRLFRGDILILSSPIVSLTNKADDIGSTQSQ